MLLNVKASPAIALAIERHELARRQAGYIHIFPACPLEMTVDESCSIRISIDDSASLEMQPPTPSPQPLSPDL